MWTMAKGEWTLLRPEKQMSDMIISSAARPSSPGIRMPWR